MLLPTLALRSVLRNWRHSSATVLSITLGFIAIAAIQGYYADCGLQFEQSYVNRTMTGHIIIDKRGGERSATQESTLLSEAELAAVGQALAEEEEQVNRVVRFLSIEGIIAGSGPSFAYAGLAYDVLEGEIVRGPRFAWNAMFGRPLDARSSHEIVVGRGLAELLGCKLEGLEPELNSDGTFRAHPAAMDCFGPSFQLTALTEKGQMNAADAVIRGVVDAGMRDWEDSWLMMPLEEAQLLSQTKKLTMLGVHLKDASTAGAVRDRVAKKLAKEFPQLTIDRWQEHPFAHVYRTMMGMMLVLQIFMLSIVVVVSALSMVNTMIRSIDERQAEIGTLRAVGYENRFVIALFAWEGAVLGLIGSAVGVLGIYGISKAVAAAEILYHPAMISQKVPLRIAFVPEYCLLLTLILSGGAALTALLVARFKISKTIANLLH